MKAPAHTRVGNVPYCPFNAERDTISVCIFGVCKIIIGSNISFHIHAKLTNPAVRITGWATGSMILVMICNTEAPSILPASISEEGIFRMYAAY